MVPDSLLALFDENELELLICGVRDYKLSELVNLLGIREIGQYNIMIVNHIIKISCNRFIYWFQKEHHTIVGNGLSSRTISWFWFALEHFTQGKR